MKYVSLIFSCVGALLYHFISLTEGYAFLFKQEVGYLIGFIFSLFFTALALWLSIIDFKKKKYIKTEISIIIYVITWLISSATIVYLIGFL